MRSEAPIHLAKHVHVCRTKHHVVLLDLRRNKYLGIGEADAHSLGYLVEGWLGRSAKTGVDSTTVRRSHELLQEMLETGMLIQGPPNTAACTVAALETPSVALIDGYSEVRTRITALDLLRFIAATLRARTLLRRRSLEQIAERVRSRRSRFPAVATASPDVDRVRRLVAAFTRMRAFFFTANNECLFDSLALTEFLSRYRILPNWVFGVTTSPFAAHCWLQQGDLILNDSPDNVGRFTRIMVL